MGQAIIRAAEDSACEIAHALDQGDEPERCINDCDAVIDFSFHAVTPELAKLAAAAGKPMVIGTTGLTDEEEGIVREAAARIPIVKAGNYSVGVNLLNFLTETAARILGVSYHPEVVEMHHRHKIDAPSGTAARLLEIIREARGLDSASIQHGRHGITGERPDEQIGSHALRGGDVVGEHTVYFFGEGERIELTHKATDRRIFAQGALRAAAWCRGQKPGMYDMQEVLGLKHSG